MAQDKQVSSRLASLSDHKGKGNWVILIALTPCTSQAVFLVS